MENLHWSIERKRKNMDNEKPTLDKGLKFNKGKPTTNKKSNIEQKKSNIGQLKITIGQWKTEIGQ